MSDEFITQLHIYIQCLYTKRQDMFAPRDKCKQVCDLVSELISKAPL